MTNKSKRTTIYMSDLEKGVLETMSELTGKNQSELIRIALLHYQHSHEFESLVRSYKQIKEFQEYVQNNIL